MGGSGGRTSGGGRSGGGESGAGGGDGVGADDGCPPMLRARLPLPNLLQIHVGEALSARLGGTSPETVVVYISATGNPIGTLAGIPELAQLIRCLARGVQYLGSLDRVANGAVEAVLWRK